MGRVYVTSFCIAIEAKSSIIWFHIVLTDLLYHATLSWVAHITAVYGAYDVDY